MEISFIGAGKAALSLGKYFKNKGHNIKYIWDTDEKKRKNFSAELKCEMAYIDFLIGSSQMVFLTVNDSSIYPVWSEIKNKIRNTDTVFIHCSGAKEGIYEDKALYALHPACAMTGNGDLEKICFGLENHGERIAFIKEFIESMGNRVFLVSKDKKKEYHLASVFVSNLVLSLVDRGVGYLKESGLTEEESLSLLMPLAKQNLGNIFLEGIKSSVTGPVAREDFEVVKGHLAVAKEEDKELYKYLSQNILRILGKNIDIETVLK